MKESSDAYPPPSCAGKSAHGDCAAPPVFAVVRPAGPGRTRVLYACGRHMSWLLRYVTVPGQSVTVQRLAARDSGD